MESEATNDDWHLPWRGACRCGQSTVHITQPPLLASACHCVGCQKMSASAFSLTLAIPSEGFSAAGLEPEIGGAHGAPRHHFCAWCKTWLYTRVPGLDQFVNVRATLLDDHRWFQPYVELSTAEKLPWATTGAKKSFLHQPPLETFAELVKAFGREGTRPNG